MAEPFFYVNNDLEIMKRVFLISVLIISTFYVFPQKSYFGGGIVFGNTLSAMSADNIPGYWKTGITAGLFGNVKLVDNYNVRMLLQLDMNFTIKGTRSKPNFGVKGLARKDKHSTSLGYIEFPLLLRFRFNSIKIDNDGVWLDFGPTIGFLLYQRTVQRHHVGTPAGTLSWSDVWDDYYDLNRFEFSFLAGITYVFKRHHGISFRYGHSILPIGVPKWEVTSGLLKKHYNSTFYLTYSYQI